MFASLAHNPRLPIIVLILALLGLLALLIAPVVARHRADRLHNMIEDQIEPARDTINRAMTTPHEIHTSLHELYFYPDQSAPQKVTLKHYQDLLKSWRKWTQDSNVPASGPRVAQHWQSGVALLNQWLERYRNVDGIFNQGSDMIVQSDKLFKEGI